MALWSCQTVIHITKSQLILFLLTTSIGLKVKNLDKGSGTGFYDGKKFVLKLTGSTFKDKFK